jgi:hypothetical protein
MIILIVITIIIMTIITSKTKYCKKENMCFGGGPYKIPCEFGEKFEAKSLLKILDDNGNKLIKHLSKNYPDLYITENLLSRYKTDSIRETHPSEVDDTSYTINKGEILSMCLRKPDGTFHDMSLLMYVYLHELAHIAENDDQHTDTFWETYLFLIKHAIDIGIYTPIDYKKNPTTYCDKVPIHFNLYLES